MSITEPITNAQLGDVDHAYGFKAKPFPKKVGDAGTGDHLILKGQILAKDPDDTTITHFTVAKSGSTKPFIVARGNLTINPSYETVDYIVTDSQGNLRDATTGKYISALETDETVSAVFDGYIVVEFAEEVQYGDAVTFEDDTGKAKNWSADEQTKVGTYEGRPGYGTGEFPPGPVTTGQLGRIKVVQ